ncbi:MAG: type II toxin-antitoxin system RelE/ParE family toxin [Deltaproteobacteria bacterium]|nr:type II toxin-antitoxin system RelE/ParE family toxin [Deltaproteobacteria bacterium]MBI4796549.1 type II toxin-antitoxin system RelE/ParE family toxin [Deltaproteobacteria bacterium]
MSYSLTFGRQARKEIKTFDAATIRRIENRLRQLSNNPLDPRISKVIKMSPGRRTSRVGDWRIIYKVVDSEMTIEVVSIWPRRKAY